MDYSQRLHKVIPDGCHTYSRGDQRFPSNAPQILSRGKGAYVYDGQGKEYLDYGMGLRAVGCGYAEWEINKQAIAGMVDGNCLTRPSLIELEAAERACDILGFDMVKFTKNGSTATTAAVKLARAASGYRSWIACPADQPFFSYDDWFISTTSRHKGTTTHQTTKLFKSVEYLAEIVKQQHFACIIMEPIGYDLSAIRKICDDNGIILIFDEMITGFRYHGWSKAAHDGVKPDLSCFGKAMANGFSVACVGGKREIMEIGAHSDFFLASTTHGAEMCGLNAFIATVDFMKKNNVSTHIRDYLAAVEKLLPDPMPEKTLFMQEMIKNAVLMPYLSPCYRHGEKELEITKIAIEKSLEAIAQGAVLTGSQITPVFA